ncbi:TD and POZ domain-containing protein 5 [Trichonephila clavata]|uniref:TD and POZ domain-containing protein 5 n=1 Tax=Trichonephila clavata TaxID=2740835 RepID=A0A8X6LJP5_TRICU|nr:TD and POZ domain-containing protein 5 [Trichonephila clavata]
MSKISAYNIRWKIVNFSYLWHAKGERIDSPLFSLNELDDTKWKLRLYPRGGTSGNYIAYFLRREAEDPGPDPIEVTFELSLQAPVGCNQSRFLFTEPFAKDQAWGKHEMIKREDVFGAKKEIFLRHDDTLTAFCSVRKNNKETTRQTVSLHARTIVKVEKRAFEWNIYQFSLLEPLQRKSFSIKSDTEKPLVNLELFLTGQCCEEMINIDISSQNPVVKYVTLKFFLLDGMGRELDCGQQEFNKSDLTEGVELNLLVTKKVLMEKKDVYLPKDVLSLHCECGFTTGIAFEGIEQTHAGFSPAEASDRVIEDRQTCISDELRKALKAIHDEGLFSDMKLRAASETFSVHKNILAARSPTFKAMFEKVTKENSQECVDISDFDNDTARQMILYMYTDTLDKLCWEKSLKLYVAAVKYGITALKNECTSFVKRNLTPENVCKILILANSSFLGDCLSCHEDAKKKTCYLPAV